MTREGYISFIKENIKVGIDDAFYFEMIMFQQAIKFGFEDIIPEIKELLKEV